MSNAFNPDQFEKLNGMPLGIYVAEMAKTGNLPPDCLEYFRRNAGRWDGQHLEMGLVFIFKIDSDEARHEIVDYIGHPLKHIRLAVLGFLNQLAGFDIYMLTKIEERLSSVTESFEESWINQIHEKAIGLLQSQK